MSTSDSSRGSSEYEEPPGPDPFTSTREQPSLPSSVDTFTASRGIHTGERERQPAHPRSRHEQQTVLDFLRDDAYETASMEQSTEQRRQSIMAMDRKRRLTGSSAHDGARRRTQDGTFSERRQNEHSHHGALRVDGPSSPYNRPANRRTSSNNLPGPEVIDLTTSSPILQSRPLPPPPRRTSSTSSSRYTIPRWQPDQEVSECPICNRQFNFLFRRHHCRKCGRVVCNECSPHRITIPRQFIVQPPGTNAAPITRPSETVDLTGDDEDEVGTVAGFTSSVLSHAALGGGEKVRLCNPCVPDPQPHPMPTCNPPVLLSPGEIWRRDQGLPPLDPNRRTEALPQPEVDWERIRDLRRQQSQSRTNQPPREAGLYTYHNLLPGQSPGLGGLRRHDQPPSYANQHNSVPRPPSYSGPDLGSLSNAFPARGESTTLFNAPSHARFLSMNVPGRGSQLAGRPRVSSMLDANSRSFIDGSSSSRPLPAGPPRPRLRESDICPICRRALPPKGITGDETAREAHIMECISSRDTTSSSAPGGRQALMQTPSRAPIQMLPFVATEKDCLGDDGTAQECSICMVEYDVGDQLARLECLCRFHRECIVEWFGRKQECPLHKIA